jgi:hypothetical protein
MIEFVYWSGVLGFSPIVLVIAVRIIAMVMGSSRGAASRPLTFCEDDPAAPFFGTQRIGRAAGFGHGRS